MSAGLPEFRGEYSPTFKRIIVGGVFGGIVPGGLEASFYTEEKRIEKALETEPPSSNRMTFKRVVEAELIIDPELMRSIHKWLEAKIKDYEAVFGPIRSPEEVESRGRRKGEGV